MKSTAPAIPRRLPTSPTRALRCSRASFVGGIWPALQVAAALLLGGCGGAATGGPLLPLQVSGNHRFLATSDGAPFFWQADTGWLLLSKLTREDATVYLDDRKSKGFNVVQVMLVHDVTAATNAYGQSALVSRDLATPRVTPGSDIAVAGQYDYWDHVDHILDLAAQRRIYVALVPVWGTNVSEGKVSVEQARAYAAWLARRYGRRSNVVWLNGGDVDAGPTLAVWKTIGETLHREAPGQLITFHPRGRLQSSDWFHREPWLTFNMFQSGHRTYEQDDTPRRYGEDNWRYVSADYMLLPTKPTLDGEPSYEGIPHGLHDASKPRWTDADARRYAYWSVFAGACGISYGNNSVMQFHSPPEVGAFGAVQPWRAALDAPGAFQMVHLKTLMLSRPYYERVPNQALVASPPGQRYEFLAATSGPSYAFIYSFTGRNIDVAMWRLGAARVRASWLNPRTGERIELGAYDTASERTFDPPGEPRDGNDWVLMLDHEQQSETGSCGSRAGTANVGRSECR